MKGLHSKNGRDFVVHCSLSNLPIIILFFITFLTLFIGFLVTNYDSTIYELQTSSHIPVISSLDKVNGKYLELPIGQSLDEYFRPQSAILTDFGIKQRLPQALIVGVRKCGTRALLEMLFLHPRIQKAADEVHFFDRDKNYNLGIEWYRQKMPFTFPNQVTIEKSPSYFVTPEVPERIRAMNASIKLLLILREPVTRAISDFTQLQSNAAAATNLTLKVSLSNVTNKSFEEMVLKPNGDVDPSYRPVTVSTYHTFVLQWFEVFPRHQILIVNGDRLIEEPISEIQKIERFLALESGITRENFSFNRTKGFYCLISNGSEKCLHESKGRQHPHVNPVVVSKLRKFFNDHNQKLYDLIGEDMGWPEK